MSLFSGVWSFFKRHRRKIAVVGVITGGLAILNHYGRKKLREWQERETNQYLDRMKRDQHFESTMKTCKATINGIIPAFLNRISALANCEEITDQLKNKPSNKLELWTKLKCATFARLVNDVYGCALITTLLNVQLNVIGGYMFLDAVNVSSESALPSAKSISNADQPAHAPLHVQQRYLALIQRFLDVGCDDMYRFILSAVHECVDRIALNEKITLANFQTILNAVRANFEKAIKEADQTNLEVFAFIMTPELLNAAERGAEASSWDEILYNRLINETRDLFESEDCKNVLLQTVNLAFSHVSDNLASYYVSDESEFKNPNEVTIPLAKLLPLICAVTLSSFGESSSLLNRLFDEQKVLAANIYESFSHENRVGDLCNHNIRSKIC